MNNNSDIDKYINDVNLNKGKDNIIVFVFMPGCGPCRMTHPIFDNLPEDKNCSFIKINCEDIPVFLKENIINGFPTFLWFCKLDSGKKYKLNYNVSGMDKLNIILNEVKKNKQTSHEYYIPENSIVKAPSKKEYSINGIINETLRKFNQ